MPCKNAAKYLDDCLQSILEQTYTNWELLVVDDHSIDGSHTILKSYHKKDQRIRVLSNQGSGIISALRTGYSESNGVYITRMDADDKMSPSKIVIMQNKLEAFGLGGLAVGGVEYFCEGGLGEGYKQYALWLNELTIAECNFDEIYKECSIPSPCWMCHKTDFEKCGGFESDIYPEDYDLAFRYRAGGLKVLGVPAVLHYWRDHSERSSRTDSNYADNRFLELKITHFIQQDYDRNLPLIIWGTGRKGKEVTKLLQSREIPFRWICNNPNKIGHNVYDVVIEDMSVLEKSEPIQVIIAFVDPNSQKDLKRTASENDSHHYFYFC